MSILLRSAPRSTILPLLRLSTTTSMRSYTFSAPRLVSGYGANGKIDPQVGGEVPEYTGPSIAEKQKSGPVEVNSSRSKKMKEKREDDFEKNEYQHDEAGKPMKGSPATRVGNIVDSRFGESKRTISTGRGVFRREWSERENPADWRREMSENAERMAEKTKNKVDKAKLAAEDVSIDIKESAQQVMAGAKKAARKVKEAASSAASTASSTIKSAASTVSEVASEAMTPLYPSDGPTQSRADIESRKDDLYPTSDSEQPGYKVFSSTPEAAASSSGEFIGEDVNSVRKSLRDGPQEMPQGVGKRAKNADGTQMETGAPRT